MAVTDVVADDDTAASDADGEWAACGAGALERSQYVEMLASAGLDEISIEYTYETGQGRHGAIIRARRPRSG